jgi:hypothetical protein
MFRKLWIILNPARNLAELNLSAWATILILGAFLIATAALAYVGWTSAGSTVVPVSGYVAMAFGVLFSLVVGIGLMALLFYSSRYDYDEPPKFVQDNVDPPQP